MGFLESLVYSAKVALLGLFIVFLGLVILIGCIKIMSAVMAAARKRGEAKAAAKAAEEAAKAKAAAAPVVVPETVAQAAAEETGADEGELIAVITAALMAYNKGSNKTLVVKGIRPQSAWARAARAEQLARF